MHYEVKQLLGAGKLREAIDFVLRLQSGPKSERVVEDLVAIGKASLLLSEGLNRESLLAATTEELIRRGDTEHVGELIAMLRDPKATESCAEKIRNILTRRQEILFIAD